MTDRHAGYVVVLDQSIREDDAKPTITALSQVKGVISVEPVVDDGVHIQIGKTRADKWWTTALIHLIRNADR